MKIMMAELPSSGGAGSRLNSPNSRFSEKKMVNTSSRSGPQFGSISQPARRATWNPRTARNISVKFAAGPAIAMIADFFGNFRSHSASNGALAQPNK